MNIPSNPIKSPLITIKSHQITSNIPWNIPRINNEEVGSRMNRLEGRNVVIEQSFGAPKVRGLGWSSACATWKSEPPWHHGWSLIMRSPRMVSLSPSRSTWSLCLRWREPIICLIYIYTHLIIFKFTCIFHQKIKAWWHVGLQSSTRIQGQLQWWTSVRNWWRQLGEPRGSPGGAQGEPRGSPGSTGSTAWITRKWRSGANSMSNQYPLVN